MECPVCLEEGRESIVLECGHSFCRQCCCNYEEYNRKRNMPLECPVCRSSMRVSPHESGSVCWMIVTLAMAVFLVRCLSEI